MSDEQLPITEEWLAASGFKWHQFDRQPDKHWLLWLGSAIENRGFFGSVEDLGVEVAPVRAGGDEWFCWIRSDASHRYSRFLHIRYLRTRHDLLWLIEAMTGQEWSADNVLYGSLHTPERAARLRAEYEPRADVRLRESQHPYREHEKDPYQGGALPEHLEAHERARKGDSK